MDAKRSPQHSVSAFTKMMFKFMWAYFPNFVKILVDAVTSTNRHMLFSLYEETLCEKTLTLAVFVAQ